VANLHSFAETGMRNLQIAGQSADCAIMAALIQMSSRAGGDPVRRGFSVQSSASLEYRIIRLRIRG
jgi:hypothetical protein